jgi:hypothetical protein
MEAERLQVLEEAQEALEEVITPSPTMATSLIGVHLASGDDERWMSIAVIALVQAARLRRSEVRP